MPQSGYLERIVSIEAQGNRKVHAAPAHICLVDYTQHIPQLQIAVLVIVVAKPATTYTPNLRPLFPNIAW